jgi:hypothetical protein
MSIPFPLIFFYLRLFPSPSYYFFQNLSLKTPTLKTYTRQRSGFLSTSVYKRDRDRQRPTFPTSIFIQRQFTNNSYSHSSEYSPPSDIILLPTLFQNLPTTLSDEDIFMTKTSTPPETSTAFYLPYYCPSAQDT